MITKDKKIYLFILSNFTSVFIQSITKTCLYNFDPLKRHFYTVKLGFTGVNIIFLISAQKHRLWVLVRTASNEYHKPCFQKKKKKKKKYQKFLYENFHFLVVKCSIYLNRRVLTMAYIHVVPELCNYCGEWSSRLCTKPPLSVTF